MKRNVKQLCKILKKNFLADLAIECFEKGRRNRPLWPLQSLKEFELIFDGGAGKAATGASSSPTRGTTSNGRGSAERQTTSQSPVRRARSLSPVKESAFGSTHEMLKTRKSTTGSSAAAGSRASSDQSSATANSKKSPKAALVGTVEEQDETNDEANATKTTSTNVKKSRRSKTAVEDVKADAALDDSEKVDQSAGVTAGERNKSQQRTGPARSGETRNGKPMPYLARPGVARQSTSNTVKDVQVRKKRIPDTNSGGIESSEDNKPNRGS